MAPVARAYAGQVSQYPQGTLGTWAIVGFPRMYADEDTPADVCFHVSRRSPSTEIALVHMGYHVSMYLSHRGQLSYICTYLPPSKGVSCQQQRNTSQSDQGASDYCNLAHEGVL